MQVAEAIQGQIGQRAFFMMGAKDLMATDNGLQWRVGRNAKSVTHVTVELSPNDTYVVRFSRVTRISFSKKTGQMSGGAKTLSEISDVYVDSLRTVIQEGTGLYLSL